MSAFHQIYASVEQVLVAIRKFLLDSDLTPQVDDSTSIGSSTKQLKDIFVDGIVYFDALSCDNVVTKTGAYTALVTDHIILADTSGGAFTITLPKVADAAGLILVFIRTGAGANALTIDGDGAETINGAATNADMDAQYDMLTLYCDGTEWFIIGRYIQ